MSDWPGSSYDLFISHARSDGAWVRGYLLPALGLSAERVLMPDAFQPGAPLVTEIERAVTASRFTLLILSPTYLADVWSELGADFASQLAITQHQARLIPIQLQQCELPLRLSFRVALDCTEQANWDQEIARLRDLLGQPMPALTPVRCPYPGMAPFQAGDARFFYGREPEIDDMLQRLRHQRFLVVIGDSGSGKSSLLNAGLLPRLPESSFFPSGYWCVAALRPGSQPLRALAQALGADPTLDFNRSLDSLLAAHPPARRLLLVVDQFEELFTQAGRSEQVAFVAALQTLRAAETCSLVLAIRGDFFYTDLMETALWPVPPAERLEIAPLRGEALAAAIERPAAAQEVYLEPRLVERLLADAAEERGALPLVQEALVQLWARMDGRLLTLAAYERLGSGHSGLAAALETKANATLVELARRSPRHEVIARRIFLRLVQFGEGRSDTRRQQPEDALRSNDDGPAAFDETLKHLAENRLLTLSGEAGQDTRVDIAHEALFTGWPALRDLVREQRQPEQARRRLEDWAANWLARNRDPKALLNALELGQAEEWLASPAAAELGYSTALTELASTSRAALAAAEQEKEAARQRELAQAQALAREQEQRAEAERARASDQARSARRLRGLASVLIMVAALAVVASFLAWRQANLVSARQIGAQSSTLFKERNYLTATLLALHANQLSRTEGVEVLAQAPFVLGETPVTALGRHTDAVYNLAWRPDGKALASAGADGRVVVWEEQSGQWQAAAEPAPPGGIAKGVAWQSDGKRLAWIAWNSSDRVYGVRFWDAEHETIAFKPIGQALPGPLAWAPQGTELALGVGGQVGFWDTTTLAPQGVWSLPEHQPFTEVVTLAWEHSGRLLAAILYSGHAVIRDQQTNREVEFDTATWGDVRSAAWDTQQPRLAVAVGNGVVLWDGAAIQELPGVSEYLDGRAGQGYHGSVVGLAWHPTGAVLAMGTGQGEVILWDVQHGELLNTLQTHTGYGPALAWHPAGHLLAIGTTEGYVLLWNPDIAANRPAPLVAAPLMPEAGQTSQPVSASYAAWHASGQALAFIDRVSGGAKVWFKTSQRLVELPDALADSYRAIDAPRRIAWHPDQLVLAVGDSDGSITLWRELAGGNPVSTTLQSGGPPVTVLSWSSDGRTVAAAYGAAAPSDDKEYRIDLWDPDARVVRRRLTLDPALSPIADLAWRPGGNALAAVSEYGEIRLWSADTGSQSALFGQESLSAGNRLAWSPDGSQLAAAYKVQVPRFDGIYQTAGRVVIWDARGRAIRTLTGVTDEVTGLAWHPDGRRLATSNAVEVPFLYEAAHTAGRVQVWDVATGRLDATLQPPDTSVVLGVVWEPSGKALTIWPAWGDILQTPEVYTGKICGWLNRNLGYQDWRRLDTARLYRPACPDLPRPATPNPLHDRDEDLLLEWAATLEGGLMLAGLAILLLGALALAVWQVARRIRKQGRDE